VHYNNREWITSARSLTIGNKLGCNNAPPSVSICNTPPAIAQNYGKKITVDEKELSKQTIEAAEKHPDSTYTLYKIGKDNDELS
jgi:hypothetical protein